MSYEEQVPYVEEVIPFEGDGIRYTVYIKFTLVEMIRRLHREGTHPIVVFHEALSYYFSNPQNRPKRLTKKQIMAKYGIPMDDPRFRR